MRWAYHRFQEGHAPLTEREDKPLPELTVDAVFTKVFPPRLPPFRPEIFGTASTVLSATRSFPASALHTEIGVRDDVAGSLVGVDTGRCCGDQYCMDATQ